MIRYGHPTPHRIYRSEGLTLTNAALRTISAALCRHDRDLLNVGTGASRVNGLLLDPMKIVRITGAQRSMSSIGA
jgi:hypothetical protein